MIRLIEQKQRPQIKILKPEDSENNIIQDTESELVENTDKSGKLEKEKRYKCCCFWWIILVILILIIIVIKVKKKMEDK